MLQASEYQPGEYMIWLRRTKNFSTVAKRRKLDYTAKIKLLTIALWMVTLLSTAFFAWTAYVGIQEEIYEQVTIGILGLLLFPWLLSYAVLIPLTLGHVLIQRPREKRIISSARKKIKSHEGYKIAIAGSYGKTTAKEILQTVLLQGKKVAATPGNMNTPLGISRFIAKLTGDEEVLIFELGEARVGDVRGLCNLVLPDMGIITGVSEAHLETFGTINNIISTIFELRDFLGNKPLYKNCESHFVCQKIDDGDPLAYNRKGVNGWKVSDVKQSVKGTSFTASKGKRQILARSGLLGEHNIGIMTAVISIASELGLTDAQIEEGLSQVVPFEHRMQPRQLHGAWIIDDTYNGNSEGMKVGLKLLKQLPAKRRLYVTPGLVEQGQETAVIHRRIGAMIADNVDVTFLMKNSVTNYIVEGLQKAGYKGEMHIIDDPLEFYENLDQFVVAGDVVLMQNDWTDNYA